MGSSLQPVTARAVSDAAALTGSETVRTPIYDTLNCPQAGPGNQGLVFFQQTGGNATNPAITNMPQGSMGQFPPGFAMQVEAITVDILLPPTFTVNQTGALNDMALLLKTNRGYLQLRRNQKVYQAIPLTFCHASGGEMGFGFGSFTAPDAVQFANNGIFDGGFQLRNSIKIGEKQPFSVTVAFNSVFTALTSAAGADIRVALVGALSQPIG